ncbi:MAG: pyrroloquinoline quinone biosynthesis protein B, partial [Bradyrhizobium sp.]
AMSGETGAIAALSGVDIGQKLFLHINNSNPALLPGSEERKQAERAGWRIPHDGTEIVL